MQDMTRVEIRQIVGRNLGCLILGSATSTVDTSSLLDTLNFVPFNGDDELNGRQVIIYDPDGSIVAGSKAFVSDYAAATWDATVSPVFSASITSGDKYELWETYRVEDIHDLINQALIDATKDVFLIKKTEVNFTETDKYLYDCFLGFAGISKLEFCSLIGIYHDLHTCDTVFDELVDGDVTASVDTTMNREGSGCNKFVVATACGAGDILATDAISSVNISDCDKLEVWINSSTDLAANDIQILLDNTASCASPLETLNVPATSANTWTRHVISLANPYLDTAIISVGVKMAVDKGAFTLYVDQIKATNDKSKKWSQLSPQQFSVIKGATNLLRLTSEALGAMGGNTQLRLNGYSAISQLTDDTTDCDIDPDYVIAHATANALLSHAKSSRLDVANRKGLGDRWLAQAQLKHTQIRTTLAPNTILF